MEWGLEWVRGEVSVIPARDQEDLITGGAVIARLCQVQSASLQIFPLVIVASVFYGCRIRLLLQDCDHALRYSSAN